MTVSSGSVSLLNVMEILARASCCSPVASGAATNTERFDLVGVLVFGIGAKSGRERGREGAAALLPLVMPRLWNARLPMEDNGVLAMFILLESEEKCR